jgi:hypothetical protein
LEKTVLHHWTKARGRYGQRDFLLKEEKIDKLPLRAQKHFYVQHCGTHGSQQTGRSMCLVRFFDI